MSENRIWNKLPEESAKAFAAFEIYCKKGVGRSIAKVAEQCGKTEGAFQKWSTKFSWQNRVAAYDDFCRKIKLDQHEESLKIAAREEEEVFRKRRVAIRDAEYELGQELVDVGRKHLVRYKDLLKFPVVEQTTTKTQEVKTGEGSSSVVNHVTVKAMPHRTGDPVKAISEGLKLMRSATEMPTETIQHSFSGEAGSTSAEDLKSLTAEERQARLAKIAARRAELQKTLDALPVDIKHEIEEIEREPEETKSE